MDTKSTIIIFNTQDPLCDAEKRVQYMYRKDWLAWGMTRNSLGHKSLPL